MKGTEQVIDKHTRERIELATDVAFHDICSSTDPNVIMRSCAHWALAACKVFADITGVRACINAGSASYCASVEQDKSRIKYKYLWQDWPLAKIAAMLDQHCMPEMHVWTVVPSLNLLIDPTVKFVPALARQAGVEWKQPIPKGWLWAYSNDDLPDGCWYEPSVKATGLIYKWFNEGGV